MRVRTGSAPRTSALLRRTGRPFLGLVVAALVCGQSATAQAPPKPLGVLVPQGVVTPPLTHFTQELRGVGPGAIPVAVPDGTRTFPNGQVADHYSIDINEFTDTLHPDLGGPTTLWGYNPRTALGVTGIPVQKHLGGIIVAQRGHPAQLTFHNNLPNAHILPVDATLMGAQGAVNRTSTHLHGGFIPWISDGGPFNNWDPQGGKGTSFINNQVLRPGEVVPANEAEYYYPNDQSARLMWYHDHSVGITRPNAYAGIASAYILRDAFEASLVRDFGLPQFIEKGDANFPSSSRTRSSRPLPTRIPPSRGVPWDPGTSTTPMSTTAASGSSVLARHPGFDRAGDVRRHDAGQRSALPQGDGGPPALSPAHPQRLPGPLPQPPALRG